MTPRNLRQKSQKCYVIQFVRNKVLEILCNAVRKTKLLEMEMLCNIARKTKFLEVLCIAGRKNYKQATKL